MTCTTVPGTPPTPPERVDVPVLGWNAGANSVAELAGDVRLIIPAPNPAVGVVIGLKSTRLAHTVPEMIDFAWRFEASASDNRFARPYERGSYKGALIEYGGDDEFTIVRYSNVVMYYWNGGLVYTSRSMSSGPLLTNACLYMTGDTLP